MKASVYQVCIILAVISMQTACTTQMPSDPELTSIDNSHLAAPNLSLNIPGLSSCTTSSDTTVYLNTNEPVNIIVHGCYGSAARFRALAQVFSFHGQQTVCFNYNDRDSLMKSSAELIHAMEILSSKMESKRITVIGHSQGGLISRKALIEERDDKLQASDLSLRLMTISSPFAGISAADHCVSSTARIMSLGLVIPICKLVSGDKWYEITQASPFIQQPGKLLEQVEEHIKVVTDEVGTCRYYRENGDCAEDDFVFSVQEQYLKQIDESKRTINIEVPAGHAEIVGDYRVPPQKLISLMQLEGIMNKTPAAQQGSLSLLLSRLYQN